MENKQAIFESASQMSEEIINIRKMVESLKKVGLPQERIDELVNQVETGEINSNPDYIGYNRRQKSAAQTINTRADNILDSLPTNPILEKIRAKINKSR